MKLIGSYTSPFVRKISILLLEKGIEFEFVNEQPYNAENGVAQYNPLGKVRRWSRTRVSTGSIPQLLPSTLSCWALPRLCCLLDPKAALAVKQVEALADGIMDVALTSVREQARPCCPAVGNELLRQRENQPQPGQV